MKRSRGCRVIAAGAFAVALLAGCSGSSSSTAIPAERRGKVTNYVALGGDDNLGSRANFADAWPQRLFRTALARDSVFVNLATSRSGITDVLDAQVPAAVRLRPDLVTITLFDDAERATDPAVVERDLGRVLAALAGRPSTKVYVGTIPHGLATEALTDALDAAIRRAASGLATVVDLSAIDGSKFGLVAAPIADAFRVVAR